MIIGLDKWLKNIEKQCNVVAQWCQSLTKNMENNSSRLDKLEERIVELENNPNKEKQHGRVKHR